jgi:hypothetical protein
MNRDPPLKGERASIEGGVILLFHIGRVPSLALPSLLFINIACITILVQKVNILHPLKGQKVDIPQPRTFPLTLTHKP